MIKKEELAYAAGLFDGEGCIRMSGHEHGNTLVIVVTNTDRRVADYFAERWGGSIIQQANNGHKTIYRWQMYGRKALPLLIDIKPYVMVKQNIVRLGIDFINTLGYTLKGSERAQKRQRIMDLIYKELHPLLIN